MNPVALFCGGVTLFLASLEVRELLFYRKRNWDFSVDSGISQAGSGTGGVVVKAFSPKTRVLIAASLFILMGFCMTIFVQLGVFGDIK